MDKHAAGGNAADDKVLARHLVPLEEMFGNIDSVWCTDIDQPKEPRGRNCILVLPSSDGRRRNTDFLGYPFVRKSSGT